MNIITIYTIKEWWEDSNTIDLTFDNFNDYVGKDKYVIVEFFTKWCRYCRMLKPEYEKMNDIVKEKRDDMIVARCDVGTHSGISDIYGIYTFPIIALFFPENKKIKKIYLGEREANQMFKFFNESSPKIIKKNLKYIPNKVNEKFHGYGNETEKELTEVTDIKEFFLNQISELKSKIKEFEKIKKEVLNDYIKRQKKIKKRMKKNIITIKIGLLEISILIVLVIILIKAILYIKTNIIKNVDHLKN